METYTDIENEDAPLVPDMRREPTQTNRTRLETGRSDPFETALQEEAE